MALSYLRSKLAASPLVGGVYSTCEIPTLLAASGFIYPGLNGGDRLVAYESAVIQMQMEMEDDLSRLAEKMVPPAEVELVEGLPKRTKAIVMLTDRGSLDPKAYMPPAVWESIVRSVGQTEAGLRTRYDGVLHLVTAASGAEAYYTTANNAARRETPEEARALDSKIKEVWESVGAVTLVTNAAPTFQGKLEEALQAALRIIEGKLGRA